MTGLQIEICLCYIKGVHRVVQADDQEMRTPFCDSTPFRVRAFGLEGQCRWRIGNPATMNRQRKPDGREAACKAVDSGSTPNALSNTDVAQ